MTIETCLTLILISPDIIVLIGKVIGIVMFVTINTTELRVIVGVGMAFGARIPFSSMISRINGEKILIVVIVSCWSPAWVRRMTHGTIGRKT